jgi:hypothetical protein
MTIGSVAKLGGLSTQRSLENQGCREKIKRFFLSTRHASVYNWVVYHVLLSGKERTCRRNVAAVSR